MRRENFAESVSGYLYYSSSIKQEENISDQRVEESEAEKKSCPAEQHVLVAAGLSLPAITEENSTKDEAPRGVVSCHTYTSTFVCLGCSSSRLGCWVL